MRRDTAWLEHLVEEVQTAATELGDTAELLRVARTTFKVSAYFWCLCCDWSGETYHSTEQGTERAGRHLVLPRAARTTLS